MDELLRRGRGLLREQRTLQAESLLRRAAAEAPPPIAGAALAELGRLWLERGDLEAAVAAFRSARSLRPDDPGAVNLGVALRAGGDRDGAVVAYRSALALSPDLSQAHHNLGIALHDAGDLDGAITAHRAAVAHAPGWAAAWNALGMAAKAQGDVREATRAFHRARRLAPGWHLPAHNLACLALDRGDLTAAREGFRRAVALEPTAATSRLNLALVLLKTGDLAAGWREYEWRWGDAVPPPERVGRPIWNSEPLAGRRILLSGEQGLGDTLMFARFAAPVRAAVSGIVGRGWRQDHHGLGWGRGSDALPRAAEAAARRGLGARHSKPPRRRDSPSSPPDWQGAGAVGYAEHDSLVPNDRPTRKKTHARDEDHRRHRRYRRPGRRAGAGDPRRLRRRVRRPRDHP